MPLGRPKTKSNGPGVSRVQAQPHLGTGLQVKTASPGRVIRRAEGVSNPRPPYPTVPIYLSSGDAFQLVFIALVQLVTDELPR